MRYANGLEDEADRSNGVLLEIAARDSKRGIPETIQFLNDEDFCWEEIE